MAKTVAPAIRFNQSF